MNIDPWKGRASTPHRPYFNRVSLRGDENDNKSVKSL